MKAISTLIKKAGCLAICCILANSLVFAQEPKLVSKKESASLRGLYTMSATNKKIKNGTCQITYEDNDKIMAVGAYVNNTKSGVWNYYGMNGRLVQKYDFNSKTLLMNKADSSSIIRSEYKLPGITIHPDDKVEPPIKIGGPTYGFYLLYDIRLIPMEVRNELGQIGAVMKYVFTISEDGKLEGWDIVYKDDGTKDGGNKSKQSIKGLPGDAYEFIAAKVNGKPVKSQLIYDVNLYVEENSSQRTGSINAAPTNH